MSVESHAKAKRIVHLALSHRLSVERNKDLIGARGSGFGGSGHASWNLSNDSVERSELALRKGIELDLDGHPRPDFRDISVRYRKFGQIAGARGQYLKYLLPCRDVLTGSPNPEFDDAPVDRRYDRLLR